MLLMNSKDLRKHGDMLENELRKEYSEGAAEIRSLMEANSSSECCCWVIS